MQRITEGTLAYELFVNGIYIKIRVHFSSRVMFHLVLIVSFKPGITMYQSINLEKSTII